ncbi:MAG: 4Fe-4S binding protein [Deltaproteobacteria bacterium]|nr:4Fe-4S binding protein [Deltaproteobacteria bacterium]
MSQKKSKPKKNKIQEICCRKPSQWLMALLLPLVLVGGYFCPRLGFTVLALITFFLILSSKRGRFYCGWFCPMGAFHERILSYFSLQKDILPVFKSSWFRWLLFSMMMGLMCFRLFTAWGDPKEIGAVFRMMWIISMGMAIGLGLYFKPRVWCTICPMGSLQGVSSKNTYLLTVEDGCKQCGLCRKVCPIQTYPGAYKDQGQVPSIECMRCSNCVMNCPQHVLSFQDRAGGQQ